MDYTFFLKGDVRFFWPENINTIMGIPQAWDSTLNTGIGQPGIGTLWITGFLHFTTLFHNIGLNWNQILLLFWILPAILCAFFSAYKLFSYFFTVNKIYRIISGLIYVGNTYFLLLLFGGQLGVVLAYSVSPFVVLLFIRLLKKSNYFNSLFFSLVLSIQILFDPRFVYMTLLILGGYFFWEKYSIKINLKFLYFVVIIPLFVVFLLHNYWIIPLIIFKTPYLPQAYDSTAGFIFFSFATFSNTLGLLHPNWPDNIFGKISFMRAEFLLLPIIAFSSLFFIKNEKVGIKKIILFFSVIGLIGAFLAKGANDPFSYVNIFIFEHIPGMQMFRDPTKWYFLISLAYSILVPFALSKISEIITKIKYKQIKNIVKKFNIHLLIFLIFILYWVFLINIIFVKHGFKSEPIPQGYIQLKDFLEQDKSFSRTLWVPQWQRFGYFSNQHPAIGRGELLGNSNPIAIARKIKNITTQEILKDYNVKYIIVPYDSENEIFLKDREYDEKMYREVVSILESTSGLTKIKLFGKIVVFEIPSTRDRFWSPARQSSISYNLIDTTKYEVVIKNGRKGDIIIFSEGFSSHWVAKNSDFKIRSVNFRNNLNSFILPKDGTYSFEVYYEPQNFVNIGLVISGSTFLLILLFLFNRNYKKKS